MCMLSLTDWRVEGLYRGTRGRALAAENSYGKCWNVLKHFGCENQSQHPVFHILSPVMRLSVVFWSLRGRQTRRSEFCVCQQRTRAWNRTWASPRASCSSCPPSPHSPAPCSWRWDARERWGGRGGVSSDWLTPTLVVCRRRRMKTCAAEYSSWSSPCSSAPSSCHTWRDRRNRASGGEGRSWGNERTGLGNCSSSWTERRAKSRWWRYESCLKILGPPKNLRPHFCWPGCLCYLSMSPRLWRWNPPPHWSTWAKPDSAVSCCLRSWPIKTSAANSWKNKSGSLTNTAAICSTR